MHSPKIIAALLSSLAAAPAAADVVLLENGDRISGEVVRLEAGQLTLRADYGGELKLPWTAVTALETSAPVDLVLEDGTTLRGQLEAEADQTLVQPGAEGPIPLVMARVSAINPEIAAADAPVVEEELRVNFGASVTRGNTETETYSLDGEYLARAEANRLRLAGEVNYATEDDERSVNNALATAQYDHFLTERWYATSNLNLARDEFRDLALRSAAGAGMGYQFWETVRSKLSAELGLNYVYEDYEEGGHEDYPAARWGVNWERVLLADVVLFHRQEGYLRLDDAEDWLVRTWTGARMPLTERVNGSVQLNYDYDNSPPEDAEAADSAYLLKLGYEW